MTDYGMPNGTVSQNCPHCGLIHSTTCPRIASIEYEHGMVKRITFHRPYATPITTLKPNCDPMSGAARVPEENTYVPIKGGLR